MLLLRLLHTPPNILQLILGFLFLFDAYCSVCANNLTPAINIVIREFVSGCAAHSEYYAGKSKRPHCPTRPLSRSKRTGFLSRAASSSTHRFDVLGKTACVDLAPRHGRSNGATRLGIVLTIPEPTLQCQSFDVTEAFPFGGCGVPEFQPPQPGGVDNSPAVRPDEQLAMSCRMHTYRTFAR